MSTLIMIMGILMEIGSPRAVSNPGLECPSHTHMGHIRIRMGAG